MIDSHCHLDHDPLYSNIDEIISRSKDIGIQKLLTICTTNNSFKNIIKILDIDPIIYGTFGIHPHETSKDNVNKIDIVNNVSKHKKIIGVGETGLDFYYNHSDQDKQISSFKTHIEASIDLNLPIIVHSRNAESKTFDILNSYKSFLINQLGGKFIPAQSQFADTVAAGAARLAEKRFTKTKTSNIEELTIKYVRKSEAELKVKRKKS